jgi:hypothetical protein
MLINKRGFDVEQQKIFRVAAIKSNFVIVNDWSCWLLKAMSLNQFAAIKRVSQKIQFYGKWCKNCWQLAADVDDDVNISMVNILCLLMSNKCLWLLLHHSTITRLYRFSLLAFDSLWLHQIQFSLCATTTKVNFHICFVPAIYCEKILP